MSNELKFATEIEALQHLADITGKRIKVADPLEEASYFFSSDKPGTLHIYLSKNLNRSFMFNSDLETYGKSLNKSLKEILNNLVHKLNGAKINDEFAPKEALFYVIAKNNQLYIEDIGFIKLASDSEENKEKALETLKELGIKEYNSSNKGEK